MVVWQRNERPSAPNIWWVSNPRVRVMARKPTGSAFLFGALNIEYPGAGPSAPPQGRMNGSKKRRHSTTNPDTDKRRVGPINIPHALKSSAASAHFNPQLSLFQYITYDSTHDSKRLGQPEKADDQSKVNAAAETTRQDDTDKAGIIGEQRGLQPPAQSRCADCADHLRAHGPDDEWGANADRTARIGYRWEGNEGACQDYRHGDPRCAKRQTCEYRHDLDQEGDNSPVLPAICSADGKMQPALRAFNDVRDAAQRNDAQERAARPPLFPQQDDRQIFCRNRKDRRHGHEEECQHRQCRFVFLAKGGRIGLKLAEGRASDGVHLIECGPDRVLIQIHGILIIANLRGPVEQAQRYPVHGSRQGVRDRKTHHMQPKTDHRLHFTVEDGRSRPPPARKPGSESNAKRGRNRPQHQRPVAVAANCDDDGNGGPRKCAEKLNLANSAELHRAT